MGKSRRSDLCIVIYIYYKYLILALRKFISSGAHIYEDFVTFSQWDFVFYI